MRECLGWLTNCSDEKRCPMNWLELAANELPTTARCHVCDREVELHASEEAFYAAEGQQRVAAFPVVPAASLPASYGRFSAYPGSGAPSTSPSPPVNGSAGVAKAKTEPPKAFYCTLSSGESVRLDKDTMIIGRSRTCDIVIPSAKVSRQHASITRQDGDLYIEDLGSANGVWRNGEKLAGKTRISAGDVFNISEETLTFELR